MGDFFAELRQRHIYRIGAGYVLVAWAIIQILDVLSQLFALPDWIAQPAVIVLALGLPITLITTWMIEGRARKAFASAPHSPATTVDWFLAGGLAVVLAIFGYQQLSPATPETALLTETENETVAATNEEVEQVSDVLPNSVAVLPFENLSPDPDDVYFALGIHEEILNQLAKIRTLNVIARTSVMEYPGSGKSIPEIADELNVEMIMEGSVRYSGDQVRVTAQLIDGTTNVHLWTEAYDGDLSDIFGIQSEIAMNVANSLQAQLSVAEQQSIERLPTNSSEAYALFLKAMVVAQNDAIRDSTGTSRLVVQNYLDEALELDPDFAMAHALKGKVYDHSKSYDPITEENFLDHRSEMLRLVLTHADMALAIDPTIGFAHALRSYVHFDSWRTELGYSAAEQALRLSPYDPDILFYNSWIEIINDRPEEAVISAERAAELDLNNVRIYSFLGAWLHLAGRNDEASEALEECLTLNPSDSGCSRMLAVSEFARGNIEVALDALIQAELTQDFSTLAFISHGYALLGQPASAQRIFERLRALDADRYIDPVSWAMAYMGVGDYDEALSQLNAAAENPGLIQVVPMAFELVLNIWSDPMLEQPEWVEAREKLKSHWLI